MRQGVLSEKKNTAAPGEYQLFEVLRLVQNQGVVWRTLVSLVPTGRISQSNVRSAIFVQWSARHKFDERKPHGLPWGSFAAPFPDAAASNFALRSKYSEFSFPSCWRDRGVEPRISMFPKPQLSVHDTRGTNSYHHVSYNVE